MLPSSKKWEQILLELHAPLAILTSFCHPPRPPPLAHANYLRTTQCLIDATAGQNKCLRCSNYPCSCGHGNEQKLTKWEREGSRPFPCCAGASMHRR